MSGWLVKKDHAYSLLDLRDLPLSAGFSTCVLKQRQRVVLNTRWDSVQWSLEGVFGNVEQRLDRDGKHILRVRQCQVTGSLLTRSLIQIMGAINVKHASERELMIEWESSAINDMIADSAVAVVACADQIIQRRRFS